MAVLKLLTPAVVVAAVVATAAQTAPASAAPPDDLFLSGVVERGSASVVEGTAKSGTARDVRAAPAATVNLVYLDTDGAAIGAAVTPEIVATARTDAAGRYSLRLSPSAKLLAKAASNDNFLNLSLAIDTGDQVSQEAVSGYWNGRGWGRADRPETKPNRGHRTLMATDPATGESTGAKAPARESLLAGTVPCSFIVTARPTRYTKVAELHGTVGTKSKWTYGRTADSDIDAALDYDGNGGWSISGSAHVGTANSASTGATSTHVLVGYYATSNFQYTEGYYKPYGTYSGYTTCSGLGVTPWTKSLKAGTWLGGASSNGSLSQYDCYDAPQSSYRNVQMAGSFFSTSSARAQKYSGSAVFSYVSLGATSGFSTNVDLSFTWDNGRSGYSCGNNAYPTSAKIIYVN